MDDFLTKLAEDQRRMRKFLRTQGNRFKKMGYSLANAREMQQRIFVVAEPPLDKMASVLTTEYFAQLPAVPLELEGGSVVVRPDQSGELDPASSGAGPPLIARHLSRHFRKGDVLIVFAHSGNDAAIKALLGFATLKDIHAILIGGLDARAALRKAADAAITLPTRGVKTVCEASFIVARILARVARASVKAKGGEEDDRLVRLDCPACKEPVFIEEKARGKKAACPFCKARLEEASTRAAPPPPKPDEESLVDSAPPVVAEAAQEPPRAGSSRRKGKRPLKQSVLNVPVADDGPEERAESRPPHHATMRLDDDEEPVIPGTREAIVDAAGATTSGEHDPPMGLSSKDSDPEETVIAPEDVAFDEFRANATESADPFALPDAFVADLVMPQARPAVGPRPPSDANPIISGEVVGVGSSDAVEAGTGTTRSARLVSARFGVQDCKLRFGRGGYPEDDTGPEHPLESLSTKGAVFNLDPEDETGSMVDKGDELWVRLQVPAFLEPVLVRGSVVRIGGTSDGGRAGTRVELEWKDLDAAVTRKIARAADSLGTGAGGPTAAAK